MSNGRCVQVTTDKMCILQCSSQADCPGNSTCTLFTGGGGTTLRACF
jgi:hypothetical protein